MKGHSWTFVQSYLIWLSPGDSTDRSLWPGWPSCWWSIVDGVNSKVVSLEMGTLASLVSSASTASPGVICSHVKSPPSYWDLWVGNQEIKTALFPNCGFLFSGGLGLVSSIAGWNEGSEFKFSSQTLQRILEFGSSPASSGRGEETGSEM